MRRLLFCVACLLTLGAAYRYRCRGKHQPVRQAVGGYRCERCQRPLTDLVEAGLLDGSAYIHPMRRTYDRQYGTVTREYVQ